ncbi:MAG: hypothetical protein GY696_23895 [Gammaproteobacteria bacterium]|nr:hypothetical protein [Gammaproteobacteria bacterium]
MKKKKVELKIVEIVREKNTFYLTLTQPRRHRQGQRLADKLPGNYLAKPGPSRVKLPPEPKRRERGRGRETQILASLFG